MGRAHFTLHFLLFLGLTGLLSVTLDHDFTTATQPNTTQLTPVDIESFTIEGYELPSLQTLNETVGRPLFRKGRRPRVETVVETPQEVEVAEAPLPPELGNYVLSAVVIVEDRRAVLLTDPRNGQLTKRTEGEVFSDGWELNEIRSDSVVLTNRGERREVALREFGSNLRTEGRTKSRSKTKDDRASRELKIREQQVRKLQERLKQLQGQVNNQNSSSPKVETQEQTCGLSRC